MATIKEATIGQTTREIRKWTADFTDDLPSGGTVTAGTAYHTPPSGTAATPTITVSSPNVSAELDTPTVTGIHYLDILGTFSNGELSAVRVAFNVGYDDTQARSGMGTLVRQLRQMTDAGAADYEVGGRYYWSDADLQEALDRYRMDFYREKLNPQIGYLASGSVEYKTYRSQFPNQESGTAIFNLELVTGEAAGTANYSVDYARGIVTFTADQGGTSWFLSGRSYDLNAAAADVWRMKAANAHKLYDMQTDGHRFTRSQMFKHCQEMASFYAGQSRVGSVTVDRWDTQ